ncbi:MAG: helix-turn-helix transcriptional regulator [Oscillospiraceae bacterium]|jgi:transcriptional regulator with XRE-family HTH domain|nr:helix-turn-helix transcriptional regulator [Oscillospiraceae bacterium]
MAETTLAERMARIVKESGKTKVDFAKSVGITRNYLHTVLSGKNAKVSRTLALLIEKEYGYPADWVLTGSGSVALKEIVGKMNGLDDEAIQKVAALLDELEGDSQ